MINVNPQKLPTISVLITTYNEEKRLDKCLRSLKKQEYPTKKLEIILVDDKSTDKTVEIARKYTRKIYFSGRRYCEISRSIGIKKAKNDLIFLLDADNALPDKKFLLKAATPFLKEKDLVGSFPARFYYEPKDPSANRYCSLFGLNDPFQFYTQAREHLTYFEDSWSLAGKAEDKGNYYLVTFPKGSLLTLGAIGFLGKKSYMEKEVKKGFFFHSDAFNNLINQGKNKFAVLKGDIIHDHCHSSIHFLKKLRRNILYFQEHKAARTNVWALKDPWRLAKSILIMSTWVIPLKDSLRGYLKKRDLAWFLHPFFCFSVVAIYTYETTKVLLNEYFQSFFRQ